jgi:hypothetical protein
MRLSFFTSLFHSLFEPPVTEESLAKLYAEMTDVELGLIPAHQLTSIAVRALQAEKVRRRGASAVSPEAAGRLKPS